MRVEKKFYFFLLIYGLYHTLASACYEENEPDPFSQFSAKVPKLSSQTPNHTQSQIIINTTTNGFNTNSKCFPNNHTIDNIGDGSTSHSSHFPLSSNNSFTSFTQQQQQKQHFITTATNASQMNNNEDKLTCGTCSRDFSLSDILQFIDHKVINGCCPYTTQRLQSFMNNNNEWSIESGEQQHEQNDDIESHDFHQLTDLDMGKIESEVEKERIEYLKKSKQLQEQLKGLKTEIQVLKVEERLTSLDKIYEENVNRGESKYSTLKRTLSGTTKAKVAFFEDL